MSTVTAKLFVATNDKTQSFIAIDAMTDKSAQPSLEERMSSEVVLPWLPPTPINLYLSPRESAFRGMQQQLSPFSPLSHKMFLFSPKGFSYIETPRDEVFLQEPPKQSRFSFGERIVQVLEPAETEEEELSVEFVNLLKRKLNIN